MTEVKSERVIVVMSPSDLKELDNWRFEHHISSRSEVIRLAIRQLIKRGLEKE